MSEDLGFKVDYSNLTKEQLKQLCEQKGLKKSGNKADILARLNEIDVVPIEKVQEKIRVECPSCSQSLFVPSGHGEELKCPACSIIFDPRVSKFVSKHGVQIKLQNTGDRKKFVFSVFILYCALFVFGWSGSFYRMNEDCLLCLLCLFTLLPFIGLAASLGEKGGSWRRIMVATFGILSAIHVLLFIGLLLVINALSGLGG